MMKPILLAALNRIIGVLIGSFNYSKIRDLVDEMERTDLTGTEKRHRVWLECQNIAYVVGTALVNLAIESAVVALRDKK